MRDSAISGHTRLKTPTETSVTIAAWTTRLAAIDANNRLLRIPATSKVTVVTYTPAHGVTINTPHTPQRSSARNSRWLRRRSIHRTVDRTGSGRMLSSTLNTPVPCSARRNIPDITSAGSMLNTTDTRATSIGSKPRPTPSGMETSSSPMGDAAVSATAAYFAHKLAASRASEPAGRWSVPDDSLLKRQTD